MVHLTNNKHIYSLTTRSNATNYSTTNCNDDDERNTQFEAKQITQTISQKQPDNVNFPWQPNDNTHQHPVYAM